MFLFGNTELYTMNYIRWIMGVCSSVFRNRILLGSLLVVLMYLPFIWDIKGLLLLLYWIIIPVILLLLIVYGGFLWRE